MLQIPSVTLLQPRGTLSPPPITEKFIPISPHPKKSWSTDGSRTVTQGTRSSQDADNSTILYICLSHFAHISQGILAPGDPSWALCPAPDRDASGMSLG